MKASTPCRLPADEPEVVHVSDALWKAGESGRSVERCLKESQVPEGNRTDAHGLLGHSKIISQIVLKYSRYPMLQEFQVYNMVS